MKMLRIILKDLKILLSDKKALAILVIMPVILTTILSSALKGAFTSGEGLGNIKVAVVKEYDKDAEYKRFMNTVENGFLMKNMGEKSAKQLMAGAEEFDAEEIFFRDFLEDEDISKMIKYRVEEKEKALRLLGDDEVSAVVVLPEGFAYDMYMNMLTPFRNNVDLKVIVHPDRLIRGEVVQYITEAFSNAMSSMIIGKNVMLETAMGYGLGDKVLEDMETAAEEISTELSAVKVNVDTVKVQGRRAVSSFDYYAAAMMTMFILFAAAHGGRMLLEEKQSTTYQRMVAAGASRLGILTGKFFTVFVVALLQILIMITYSGIALKVAWGSVGAVFLISLCSAFAVAGIGALISAATFKADNDKMANVFETAIIQTMALVGGSFFPIEILPDFMKKLSVFSINGLALKSYLKAMMGYGIGEIMQYLVLMTAAGAAFAIAAVFIFNRKDGEYSVKHNQTKASEAA